MAKSAMDCVKLARDPKRPHLKDFIKLICLRATRSVRISRTSSS